jgi:cytochrome d ubiquinol oxidase subunit II
VNGLTGPVASLNTAWFALLGLLWTGYFVLEGFDFGVGMLSLAIGRDDVDRRLARNAIGPIWDGNEVWLIVAGGATFAAFPLWYASMFSGFYFALFIILAALIVRGVSFEFRGKRDSRRWRSGWDRAMFVGSLLPAFLWGVAFTDLVHGLSLSPSGLYQGGFWKLLTPVAVVGGLASLAMFLAHGGTFLSLKTSGPLATRASQMATWMSPLAGALVVGTAAWLAASGSHGPGAVGGTVPIVLAAVCALAFALSGVLVRRGRDGSAFALSALGIVAVVAAIFTALYPRVMVSSGPGPSLTVWNAASANETLVVMTIVAAIFVPLVLLYQGWSYWVFRQRLTRPVAQPGPEQPEQPGQHERPAGPATPGPSPGPGSGTPGSVPPAAARSAARPTPSPRPRR